MFCAFFRAEERVAAPVWSDYPVVLEDACGCVAVVWEYVYCCRWLATYIDVCRLGAKSSHSQYFLKPKGSNEKEVDTLSAFMYATKTANYGFEVFSLLPIVIFGTPQ